MFNDIILRYHQLKKIMMKNSFFQTLHSFDKKLFLLKYFLVSWFLVCWTLPFPFCIYFYIYWSLPLDLALFFYHFWNSRLLFSEFLLLLNIFCFFLVLLWNVILSWNWEIILLFFWDIVRNVYKTQSNI